MKNNIKSLIVFLIILIIGFVIIQKPHRYLYRITEVAGERRLKVGVTDSIFTYGDSIGWFNSNDTHVFFPKNSRIDTLK
jgi:hypothetical protein